VLTALEAYGSDPEGLACWKDAAAALASAYSRARLDGAARIRAGFETGGLPPMTSLIVLSSLGDVDFSFTVAQFMPLARYRTYGLLAQGWSWAGFLRDRRP
jgi:hypothetical protein